MYVQELYNLSESNFKGKVIFPTSEITRCIGKTTFLVEQAVKEDGIYINNHTGCVLAKKINPNVNTLDAYHFDPSEINSNVPLFIDENTTITQQDLCKFNRYIMMKYYPTIRS